jgi:hypothetical protein
MWKPIMPTALSFHGCWPDPDKQGHIQREDPDVGSYNRGGSPRRPTRSCRTRRRCFEIREGAMCSLQLPIRMQQSLHMDRIRIQLEDSDALRIEGLQINVIENMSEDLNVLFRNGIDVISLVA